MPPVFNRRKLLAGGTAAFGVGLVGRADGSVSSPQITLSTDVVCESLRPGARVGRLSILGSDGPEWMFRLSERQSEWFSLSGSDLMLRRRLPQSETEPRLVVAVRAEKPGHEIEQRFTLAVLKSLPTLPLRVGARVAVHGDSQMGFNNGQVNAMSSPAKRAADNFAFGTMTQARAIDPRFNFDSWYDEDDPYGRLVQGANQGIFGDHLSWTKPEWGNGVIPRLDYTISRRPELILFSAGTNSLSSGDRVGTNRPASARYVIDQLNLGLRKIRAAGIPVILATLMPRGGGAGDWAADDPRITQLMLVNDWIRDQYRHGRDGVVGLFDPWDVLAEGDRPRAPLFDAPLVHPNARGAYRAASQGAQSLLSALRAVISEGSSFDQDPAANNLLGSSMGLMEGTRGATVGGSTSGTVADGFALRISRGSSTQTADIRQISGSLRSQTIVITPKEDDTAFHYSDLSLTDMVIAQLPQAGQWCRGYLRVEIGDTTDIGALTLTVNAMNGGTPLVTAVGMQVNSGEFLKPSDGNRAYWLLTEPFLVPEEITGVQMSVRLAFPSAARAVIPVTYSRPILRVVPDPRPDWSS